MVSRVGQVYRETRKRHDQLWNTYVMRPLAAVVVAAVGSTRVTPNQLTITSLVTFVVATALLCAATTRELTLLAIGVVELSYLFDCADGMLARHKKLASQQGHLFDFFTDESKAVMLVGGMAIHLWRNGGYGITGEVWVAGQPGFLLGGVAGVAVVASAISLTNFVRRPEISGRETPVEAHYEAAGDEAKPTSPVRWVAGKVMTFLRFLNHYPSHIWLFALVGRLDAFFWLYASLNALYLGKGWLGLILRFGRS